MSACSTSNENTTHPVRFLRYHAVVEAAIQASGLYYTFLRPNLFMQGLLNFRSMIATQNAFYAAIASGIQDVTDKAPRRFEDFAHDYAAALG